MKILVDGHETREITRDTAGLAAVYRETITQLARDGRTVVKVLSDGRELDNQEQERLLKGEALPEHALSFETEDARQAALQVLVGISPKFEPLRKSLDQAAESLSTGGRNRALKLLQTILDFWLEIMQAVHPVVLLKQMMPWTEPDDPSKDDFAKIHQNTMGFFSEVRTTLQQEDWVRLNDLLEYELLPLVDEWENLVQALQNSMRSDSQA